MLSSSRSECERCHGTLQYCVNPEAPGALQIWKTCGPCARAAWDADCEKDKGTC